MDSTELIWRAVDAVIGVTVLLIMMTVAQGVAGAGLCALGQPGMGVALLGFTLASAATCSLGFLALRRLNTLHAVLNAEALKDLPCFRAAGCHCKEEPCQDHEK